MLGKKNDIFRTKPNEKQLSYIRALTGQTDAHLEDLNAIIEKYSRDWKVERISKVAATILRCAIAEILYLDEVPVSVTINEAVELAKGYEEPETVSFINGILGSFVRAEVEPDAAESKEE